MGCHSCSRFRGHLRVKSRQSELRIVMSYAGFLALEIYRTVGCRSCSRFRGHLRVKRSRYLHFDSSSTVADNSHTSYSNLIKDELVH